MKFLNKIRDRFSENYHSRYEYILAKLFVAWLMLFEIVPALLSIISWNWGEIWVGYVSGSYVTLIIFWILWIILDWIVESIFLKSWKIPDNMRELPKNIWSKNSIIEYNLTENITPSEAGMLLYGRADISNMLCLIYERINKKNIVLYTENWKKYLKKVQWLGEDAYDYERFLFDRLFNFRGWPILFDKKLLSAYNGEFNDMVFKSCVKKWHIESRMESNWENEVYNDISKSVPKRKKNKSIWCLLAAFLFPWAPIALNLGGLWEVVRVVLGIIIYSNYLVNSWYDISFTYKWREVLSKIYWYKYYLEQCEEEQINSGLKEGEIYSKHLPYAIALKLNWKIINELSK